ncbi:uncharacterized protein LOC144443651 [Glandiceps talaboti]
MTRLDTVVYRIVVVAEVGVPSQLHIQYPKMEPAEIKVVVYGAQNLRGKKHDRCKASVIFGVGGDKRRTSVINSPNPEWNEDSIFDIKEGDHSPLVFTVTDKEDILGEVTVSIATLPTRNLGRRRIDNLQAHKKCPNPTGQLMFDCWVTKTRNVVPQAAEFMQTTEKTSSTQKKGLPTTFTKMKDSLLASPMLSKKASLSPLGLSKMGRRGSRSVSDVTLLFKFDNDTNPSLGQRTHSDQDLRPRAESEPAPKISKTGVDTRPEISGLSPREGSVGGGTCITIRGTNLGEHKNDIVRLLICGSNCLSSLKYESSNKIRCTTKPWKISSGPVVIETQSGGLGRSSLKFEFVGSKRLLNEARTSKGSRDSRSFDEQHSTAIDLNRNEILDKSERGLKREIERLRKIATELAEENNNMRMYIQDLVEKVMEKCPEILEQHLENTKRST